MQTRLRTIRRRTLLAAAMLGAAVGGVQAQTWPARPIHLLVGYAAGGGVDAMARMIAPGLSAALGQQVIVENRAGAAGAIAADAVAKAAPDGYSLLMGESALLIAQHLQARLPFDPIKDFTPIAAVFDAPLLIVTSNSFPAKTPKEFVAALKASPGKYSFATSGVGTVHHLGFEMLKARTGSFVVHIPYRGASRIIPDVIGGQVPIGVVSASAGVPQAKAGKLRAIGVMSPTRLVGAEDIPPIADALPGFNVAPRLYLLAPAGTPAAIVQRIEAAVRQTLANPALAHDAAATGAIPAFVPGQALAGDLTRESASWAKLIKDQKLTAD